jgi:hypothetical protein
MRKLIVVVLFIFYLVLTPPVRSQGTFTAASCNRSDVNAIINGPTHVAVDGDVINIPAGSCTWSSGIGVPSGIGISIIGRGTPNTTAETRGAGTINTTLTGGAFFMSPTFGNSLSRISLINFLPGTTAPITVNGTCTASGCPNLRLDNLIFPTSWETVRLSDGSVANVSNVFGVADHNTVGDTAPGGSYLDFLNLGNGSWQGVGSWGDNSWASADTFGTAQTFYLENNIFNYSLGTDTDLGGPNGGGARLACRFNTFNNISFVGACSGHGTDTTGRARGVRQWEGYDNTGTCSSTTMGCGSAWPGRSGVGRSFGNSFTNSGGGFFKGLANISPQRRWRPDTPWGGCTGTSPWDTNDGVTHYSGTIGSVSDYTRGGFGGVVPDSNTPVNPNWTTNQWATLGTTYSFWDVTQGFGFAIASNTSNSLTADIANLFSTPVAGDHYQILRATVCMDQSTRGAGALVTGSQSAPVLQSTGKPGPVNQVLDPTYEAADSLPATADHTIGGDLSIIANRDYYVESVNQAAQSSPPSPFNGTSGSGHGTLANRPTTCTPSVGYWATDQGNWNQSGSGGQGELFVCTAPNTWSLYYEPYTYPHPLIAGGNTGTSGNSPNPPTNVTVTVH